MLEFEFSDSASRAMRELFPDMVRECVAWMNLHYPEVDFGVVKWRLVGGWVKSRYCHKTQEIKICHHGDICFYARACREIPRLKEVVGKYHAEVGMATSIIHELTHHVQYARGFHKGNETDTTLNELCWLQERQPAIYARCFTKNPPKVEPARIRPRPKGEPLPPYLCKPRRASGNNRRPRVG